METYDQIDALNWSTLKHMDGTPKKAKHIYDHPEEQQDKKAYREGRVIHCAILEPDDFHKRYVVSPVFSGTGSRAAKKEWVESLPDGAEIITQAEIDLAWRCSVAVNADEHAMKYLDGARFEQIVTWKTGVVDCKGRIDALTDRVIDLKTTRRDNLYEVEKDAATYNYHAQLAWYHDGAVKAGLIKGNKLPLAIFIHASVNSTYIDIAILDMDEMDGTFAYGRAKYQALLQKYIGCKTANWWPGMAPKPRKWVLPDWKLKADEEEVKVEYD